MMLGRHAVTPTEASKDKETEALSKRRGSKTRQVWGVRPNPKNAKNGKKNLNKNDNGSCDNVSIFHTITIIDTTKSRC